MSRWFALPDLPEVQGQADLAQCLDVLGGLRLPDASESPDFADAMHALEQMRMPEGTESPALPDLAGALESAELAEAPNPCDAPGDAVSYRWAAASSGADSDSGSDSDSDETSVRLRLGALEQLMERVAETVPVGLLYIDAASQVVHTNDLLHSILGVGRRDCVGEQLATVHEADLELVDEALEAALDGGIDTDVEVCLRPFGARANDLRYCQMSTRALTDDSGVATGAVVCIRDLTDEARADGRLGDRAALDHAGCADRATTLRGLEALVSDRTSPAVILVHLDQFKEVDDTLGRESSAELSKIVAERLLGCVRSEDLVGTVATDEFLVVCPWITSAEEARSAAWRVWNTLRNEIRLKTGLVDPQASIGVAWSGSETIPADHLVAMADGAVHRSRTAGSGEPELFDLGATRRGPAPSADMLSPAEARL